MSVDARAEFTSAIVAFAANLREEHGFLVAHAKAHDALRAAEVVGVSDRRRLRDALRLVFCASPDEVTRFDRAFDAFFGGPEGVAQPNLPPRSVDHVRRPGEETPRAAPQARGPDAPPDASASWQTLRARYSPASAQSEAPVLAADALDAILAAASRLVLRVRLGRSRRWRPARYGARFDLRRTLRASLQTGGDPVALHRLGPPLRNPRFVVLIDGSRSMAQHAALVLQFAYALCQRSRRAHAFVFSTSVRDVTREFRVPGRAGTRLPDLGTAWGGGTRIGACLNTVVRARGARLFTPDTLVFVASDGLDVGGLAELDSAMRAIRSNAAGIVWLHPHAGSPSFRPASGGMRTALPYLTLLAGAAEPRDFTRLANIVARRI